MKISFHIGAKAFGEVNTITFFEISQADLEILKALTSSELEFNCVSDESYKLSVDNKIFKVHNFTIYLPILDKNLKPYGNFLHLFKHEKYLNWKKKIIDQLPESSTKLELAEKDATARQELEQLENTLQLYTESSRYRFQQNADAIASLKERVSQLRKRIYPHDDYYDNDDSCFNCKT